MKGKNRILLLGLTAILCLLIGYQTVYAAEEDKDVENNNFIVNVEVGIDGVAVEYRATPVTVTVRNLGADFEGTLRVVLPATYDQKSLAYEKMVTVPSGGEKTFSVLLPDIQNTSFVRVELETTKGKLLYSGRQSYYSSGRGQDAIVGVLSSDYTGLNYFDGVTITAGSYGVLTAKLLQLTADNIPEISAGLETCDYIIIDNYNTSQLTDEQCKAIVSWVNNGGVLILGTGSKASVVLEGFRDTIVPGAIGSLTKNNLTVYANDTYTVEGVDTAELSMENWIDIESYVAAGAPVWQSSYGGGSVAVLSYDLAMNPVANWKVGRGQLAMNILSYASSDEQFSRMTGSSAYDKYDEYDIDSIVTHVDRNKIPNSFLYGFIFLIYVVVIGPVAYLVLRAMDKREKLWIVMPCVALGFTMIILLTSMMYKIHKPFIDELSIVEFNNGLKSTISYMSIQSPKGREYDVDLNEVYQEVAAWNQDVEYGKVGSTDYEYTIRDRGDHLSLHMAQAMAFTRQNLLAEKQEYSGQAGLVPNLTCSLNGMEGDVYNGTGYNLKNVVICYSDKFVFIGDMKNGDTAAIHLRDNEDVSIVSSWYVDYWMDKTPDDLGELRSLIRQSDEYVDLTINQSAYRMIHDNVYNLELYQGMIFGMIDDYDPELTDSSKVKVYSAGMAVSYFQQIPEEYQQYSMFIDDINDYMVGGDQIPYSSDYPEGYSYFYDTNTRDMYAETSMEVLYDFSSVNRKGAFLLNNDVSPEDEETPDYEDLDITDFDDYQDYIDYVTQMYNYGVTNYASVELYNWQSEQYDKVFGNGNQVVTDLEPYVDINGLLLIRYTCDYAIDPNGYYECYGPHISLIGGEQ